MAHGQNRLGGGHLTAIHFFRLGPLFVQWSDQGVLVGTNTKRLQLTRSAPLFSERNGYDKPLFRFGQWRLRGFNK